MAEQSYNLKYTGKEIDDLLDKANDMNSSAQVPTGGASGQVLTKKSGTDFDAQWETPGVALPTGGTAEQILTKNSATDGDASWKDAPIALPDGGDSGQVLTKNSSTNGDASWKTPEAPSNPLPVGGTTGQVLAKSSNTDFDVTWVNQSGGSGGGSSDSNIVVAVYQKDSSGTASLSMTYDEIVSAIGENKVVIIKDNTGISDYCSVFVYQYTSTKYGLTFVGTTDSRSTYIDTPFIRVKSDGTMTTDRVFRNGTVISGGNAGQFLRKKTSYNYDTEWVDAGAVSGSLPAGGYPGEVLRKKSVSDFDAEWVSSYDSVYPKEVWKNKNNLDTFGAIGINVGASIYVSGKSTTITSNYTLCYTDAEDISAEYPLLSGGNKIMYTITVPGTDGARITDYSFKMQTARGYRYCIIDTDVSYGLLFSDGFNMQGTKDNSVAIPYAIFASYTQV